MAIENFLISRAIWVFGRKFPATENCHKFSIVFGQKLAKKQEIPNDSCQAVNKI